MIRSTIQSTIQTTTLTGSLLVATPSLKDPNFERSIILVCGHSEDGTFGLVVNRPHTVTMKNILNQLGISWNNTISQNAIVYQGGPVGQDRAFILYETPLNYPGHITITPNLFMGTNLDVLHHFSKPNISDRFIFTLGYAGWNKGQLESELRANAWLIMIPDHQILFELPIANRWPAALEKIGINPWKLMTVGSTLH